MGRYFVSYHAPLSARERLAQAMPEQAMAGVKLWMDWGDRLGPNLLDPGRPFGQSVKVTSTGSAPTQSDVVGISIIEANTMDDALAMVTGHHHLNWAPGCSITVQEEIEIPELVA